MKEKHTLIISGIKVSLVSEDPKEYIEGLAELLENRINSLQLSGLKCTKNEALLMCALDYLDERNKLAEENAKLKEQLKRRNKSAVQKQ